jgi:hypothetical protein
MSISGLGENGMIPLDENGVHVAEIIADPNPQDTGGVTIYPTEQKVYQSILSQTVDVTGDGFKSSMSLTLSPPLEADTDYELKYVNPTKLQLSLKDGKQWAPAASTDTPLKVMRWTIDEAEHEAPGGFGVRIATVLPDPKVNPGDTQLHVSQSKALVFYGSGFSDRELAIELSPTPRAAFKVSWVMEDTVRLLLNQLQTWLPSALSPDNVANKTPVKVIAINTGAGRVNLGDGVIVAYLIPDKEGVTCDDTCEFAFDGVCDDTSAVAGDQNWGRGGDDDYGGYAYGKPGGSLGTGDEEYYYLDDEYTISACYAGTDCTDCGGVDAMQNEPESECSNTCVYARDGSCDDPRGGNYCPLGSDCQDCGPVGHANFSTLTDDGWWDDDDDYWDFNDGEFLDQTYVHTILTFC